MLVTCNLSNVIIKILIVNIKLVASWNQNANPKLHTSNVSYTLGNIVQNWNTKCNCTQIYFISIHMDPSCMLQWVLTLVGAYYLPRLHNCNHPHFVPPFNLFCNIKFQLEGKLSWTTLFRKYKNYFVIIAICFFFLKPFIKATVHKKGGAQYFPTWGDMYSGKKKFPPGVCPFIKKFVLWSNPKSCMHCSNIFLCCNVGLYIACVQTTLFQCMQTLMDENSYVCVMNFIHE